VPKLSSRTLGRNDEASSHQLAFIDFNEEWRRLQIVSASASASAAVVAVPDRVQQAS
jgi:hypothetical protein